MKIWSSIRRRGTLWFAENTPWAQRTGRLATHKPATSELSTIWRNKHAYQHCYYYHYYHSSNMKHTVICSRQKHVFPCMRICTALIVQRLMRCMFKNDMWGTMRTHVYSCQIGREIWPTLATLIRRWGRYSISFCKRLALLSIHV